MAEGPRDPQGPFLYQEGGKTYASLPTEMLQNIQRSNLFQKMQKDCQAEGIEIPKTIMAKDPVTHGIFTKGRSRDNASDGQSSNDEGNGRKRDREQPDEVHDGVS